MGAEEAQRSVWPVVVVLEAPVLGKDLDLGQRMKDLAGEEFVAEAADGRFANPVLPWRSWVDERRIDPGEPAPVGHRVCGHLGAVVHADVLGFAPGRRDDLVEHADRRIGGAGPESLDGEGFPGELVDDVGEPHLPAVDGEVELEIQRPHLIRSRRPQPLMAARADPALLTHPDGAFQPFLAPEPLRTFSIDHQGFGPAPTSQDPGLDLRGLLPAAHDVERHRRQHENGALHGRPRDPLRDRADRFTVIRGGVALRGRGAVQRSAASSRPGDSCRS